MKKLILALTLALSTISPVQAQEKNGYDVISNMADVCSQRTYLLEQDVPVDDINEALATVLYEKAIKFNMNEEEYDQFINLVYDITFEMCGETY